MPQPERLRRNQTTPLTVRLATVCREVAVAEDGTTDVLGLIEGYWVDHAAGETEIQLSGSVVFSGYGLPGDAPQEDVRFRITSAEGTVVFDRSARLSAQLGPLRAFLYGMDLNGMRVPYSTMLTLTLHHRETVVGRAFLHEGQAPARRPNGPAPA